MFQGVISVVDPMDHPVTPRRHSSADPRWLFRVVDVVSGATLVEDASTRRTVDLLGSVESIFDVWIFVWVPDRTTWRQLTPGEQRMLWDFRGR